jgi:hypothetical protein
MSAAVPHNDGDRGPLRVIAAANRLKLQKDVGAVKAGDWLVFTLPPPARHHTILHAMHALGLDAKGAEQAFLLSDGTFADRVEAGKVALAAGQLPKLNWAPLLFSEDLW